MRNSEVIARCLFNSAMFKSLEEGEHAVRTIFHEEYPGRDFDEWNLNLDDRAAMNIINNVGRASRIVVKDFIEDLSRWEGS